MEDRIDQLLKRLQVEPSDDGFIRGPRNDGQVLLRIPAHGEMRDLKYVPPEEIRAAVEAVVSTQGQLPDDALISEVARVFGYARVREATRTLIKAAMSLSSGGKTE